MGAEAAVFDILLRRGLGREVAASVAPVLVRQIVEDDPGLTVTDEGSFYELLVAVSQHRA